MKRGIVVLCLLGVSSTAHSQTKGPGDYPARPVRFIVPFAPGGGTDIVGRVVANKLTSSIGQTVVVDNRGGAGGSIGSEMGVKAAPDGYTFTMAATSYAANAALLKLPYDPVADITPIGLIGHGPFIVVLHPSLPAANIKQLIALAKAKPGWLNYATTGPGSITHLGTELLGMMTGTKMIQVPYKGTGPALTEIISGHIQFMLAAAPAALPQIQAKRLRAIAVTSLKRSQAAPDIPTVAESGVPNYEVLVWYAVYAPRGLPAPIVTLWNGALSQAVAAPEVKNRLASEGIEPVGGGPEAFADLLRRDIARWKAVVKQADIKAEMK